VENYIQGKCEVDCYVTSPIKVAQSKEVINDNIIALIEGSFNFIWRNIQVGVGYAKGGIAEPEYPEELIRECINNAIAHRNYSTDRFVIIEIRPQTNLTIRNPGNFQRRQRINLDTPSGKIRRIIPIQVARNPKLTHILKSFDYWEGKGRGLSSLTDACLDNQIDVPYYVLSDGEIKLVIPTGKVWDSEMEIWFQSFAGFLQQKIGRNLADDEKIMLSFFRKSELLNRLENYTILLTNDNNHKDVIMQLEEKGLIFKDSESPEFYPIYKVHRSLMKDDFSDDLKNCLGIIWDELKDEYKDILNSIYFYNVYGGKNESISANLIGNAIYMKQYKVIQDGNNYENFKRKVRNIFNQLENKRLIVRKDGKSKDENGKPDFKINEQYKNELELFNL
jgi:hypothetical protein